MASLGSLVIELAANTARLQGDLGRGVAMLQGFARSARSAVGFLGVGVGGGLFGGLVRDAVKLGDELQKGAQRAGLGAGKFSELAAAAKQADVEMGTLSKGLRSLQVSISNATAGGKEAQESFRVLGLDVAELSKLNADQQLLKVADALKRLGQEDRARIGAQLLSKAYLEMVPLLDEGAAGIRALVEEQRKLGNTFSDEQIRKLAETDDSIKRLSSSWSGFATTLTASVAPALTSVFNLLTKIGTSGLNESAASIRERLASIEQGFDEPAKAALRERLAQAEEREARERTQRRLQAVSRGPGLSGSIEKSLPGDPLDLLTGVNVRARRIDTTPFQDFYRELDELTKTSEENAITSYRRQEAALKELLDAKKITQAQFDERSKQLLDSTLPEFGTSVKFMKTQTDEMIAIIDASKDRMKSALADFLFDPFKDGLEGMFKGFVDVLRRMIAEAAAAKIFASTSQGGFGLGDFLTGIFGGFLKFADGGRPPVGRPSIVGERGPELFVPSVAGAIIPNNKIGGMVFSPVYNIDARGSSLTRADVIAAVQVGSRATIAEMYQLRRAGRF